MSKAASFLDKMEEEGSQYRTKVKSTDGFQGSRHIRHLVEGAKKRVGYMTSLKHPSPNPKTKQDVALLNECVGLMEQCISKLREVKDTKKRKPEYAE